MKGVYVLAILIRRDLTVKVGALGAIEFRRGVYAYVGSAQNGLEQRVKRHFMRNKRKFWHIDYLLSDPDAKILGVFYKEAGKEYECVTAQKMCEAGLAVYKFGCSDCNCVSHLFLFRDFQSLVEVCSALNFSLYLARESPYCEMSEA
ncbi:GIY-YIG nuclease family protein [Candidatus Bathyarchaeota archaeon]|nr:GIY-YIG nuclease family protein [Candidatus Bathyarchaeota archaeon]